MPRRSLVARVTRRLRRRRSAPTAPDAPQRPAPAVASATLATPASPVASSPVDLLGDALWAGFVGFARTRLEELSTSHDQPGDVAAAAAHHLATWALTHDHLDLAQRCAERLDTTNVEPAVVAALIARRCGDHQRAASLLDAACERWPDDPHLRLHRANLGSPADRLAVVDALARQAACEPVAATGVVTFAELPVLPTRRAQHQPVETSVEPLVSIIVPAFRAQASIAHAVASLQAQTYTNLQIIVVDDAGGDQTADIVRQLTRDDARISLVRQPVNRGAYAARNAGLDRVTGALVTVHDADDWAHPQRIEHQVRHLLTHPDVVANATQLIRVDHDLLVQPHGRHPYKLIGKNTASLMVRREIFSVVGPWDAGVRGGADFEFVKRLEARFGTPAVAHLLRNVPLTWSLRHDASLTSAASTGMRSLWHLYGARRQYLDAFTVWHRSERFARELPWRPDGPRPFPAPVALQGVAGTSFVDVVVRGDLTAGGSGVADAVAQVVRAAGAGRSLALWHEPHDLDVLEVGLDLAIVRLVADQRARLLSAGESVRCQELITVGRPSVLGAVDGAPEITVVPS